MNSSTFNSKKYIITLIIVLFVYLIVSYSFEMYKKDFLEANFYGEFQNYPLTGRIDVINTGTSHGSVSFDWKNQGLINGVNFARSGQPLSYDMFLLENYRSQIKNAIIVVPISFHTLCMESRFFYPVDSIYNNSHAFIGLHQSRESISFLLNHRKDRPYYSDTFRDLDNVLPEIVPSKCELEIELINLEYIYSIYENFSETNKIILVTTPYYLPSLGEVDLFKDFYNNIDKVVSELELDYYDYSRDPRFNYSNLFYNKDHLNSEGRKLFTYLFTTEVLKNHLS